MTKHTPGPWHTAGVVDPDGPSPTASIWGPTPPGMQSGEWICRNVSLKNARLIAATPDMAEALLELRLYADGGSPVHPGSLLIDRVRTALAKAGM